MVIEVEGPAYWYEVVVCSLQIVTISSLNRGVLGSWGKVKRTGIEMEGVDLFIYAGFVESAQVIMEH